MLSALLYSTLSYFFFSLFLRNSNILTLILWNIKFSGKKERLSSPRSLVCHHPLLLFHYLMIEDFEGSGCRQESGSKYTVTISFQIYSKINFSVLLAHIHVSSLQQTCDLAWFTLCLTYTNSLCLKLSKEQALAALQLLIYTHNISSTKAYFTIFSSSISKQSVPLSKHVCHNPLPDLWPL